MDNIKLAVICIVLFSLSIALILFVFASINGFSECDDCEPLPLWISMNNSIVEIDKGKTTFRKISRKAFVKMIDFHFKNNDVYWVEESGLNSTKIYRSHLKDSESSRTPKYQLVAELLGCGGLAVDWLHNHLYWADSLSGVVVARLDGNHRRPIISTTSDTEITTLAVDPLRRLLFWMEKIRSKIKFQNHKVQIKSSNFKGLEVTVVVNPLETTATYLSNSIALDVTERKLYFVENEGLLIMCDYDGNNKAEVMSDLPTPVSFTVARKQLYWMDGSGGVFTSTKNGNRVFSEGFVCKDCNDTERKNAFDRGFQLKVFDGRMQPTPEHQEPSQDCLLNYSVTTEVCPCLLGYRSIRNSNYCEEEGFFLSSFGSIIQGINSKDAKLTLQFKSYSKIIGFDYHFVKGLLFWFDDRDSIIYRAPIFNPSNKVQVTFSAKGTKGLAVDWIYDHIYWTNYNVLQGGAVEVCKLDGTQRLQVVPRNYFSMLISIALDPARGKMFISNWTEGTIEVMGMDGHNQQNLVPGGLRHPHSLTLDVHQVSKTRYEARQLFWIETAALRRTQPIIVKSCYLQNELTCREVFSRRSGPLPSAFTFFNNRIYWLYKHAIHYVSMDSSRKEVKKLYIGGKHSESYLLKVYHSSTQPPAEYFCLWKSCQPGSLCLPSILQYSKDKTRCVSSDSLQELRSHSNYFNSNRQ